MAEEKKNNAIEELTDDQANEAAGGFRLDLRDLAFVVCATPGCMNKFRPVTGETLCENCRKKARAR